MKIWYRYWDRTDDGVHLAEYRVLSETDKTVLLAEQEYTWRDGEYVPHVYPWAKRVRVLKDARKRFAYPTKALAWNSYQHRNRWRIGHLERQLAHARSCQAYIAVVNGLTQQKE